MSSSDDQVASQDTKWSLESVRDNLIRQEDTIVYSLIERAKYKYNWSLYNGWYPLNLNVESTFLEYFVKETEDLQAKFGRYEDPVELRFSQRPAASDINVNSRIWEFYNMQLPLFVSEGQDEKCSTCIVARDLECLQALSRRIHFGKIVAEVKFTDNPEVYTKAIQAQDRDGLMKLLTFEKVEEQVVKRVKKKAMVFGQDVSLVDNENDEKKYKVDPSVVGTLYEKWVIPLTKEVQVEYLLRRLD